MGISSARRLIISGTTDPYSRTRPSNRNDTIPLGPSSSGIAMPSIARQRCYAPLGRTLHRVHPRVEMADTQSSKDIANSYTDNSDFLDRILSVDGPDRIYSTERRIPEMRMPNHEVHRIPHPQRVRNPVTSDVGINHIVLATGRPVNRSDIVDSKKIVKTVTHYGLPVDQTQARAGKQV